MSVSVAPRVRQPLDLPPPYSLVTLRETGDAFACACRIAPDEGAGALVHVGRFDVIEFAVVLEPEEALAVARRAFFVGMGALAHAIGAHSPPEKAVNFDWPDVILFDGARIGGARLGWPSDCREDETPAWLVFSVMLLGSKIDAGDPGLTPDSTSLEEERFFENGDAIIESFARYLMIGFDTWSNDGFEPSAIEYLSRLTLPGKHRLAPNGDLLVGSGEDAMLRLPLLPALNDRAWLDPTTRAPRF